MLIVIPRARSSGALSMLSKGRKSAPPCSASVFVIAAVSVVLPWSMCPIVPTLIWGLLRSNFCFAIASLISYSLSSNCCSRLKDRPSEKGSPPGGVSLLPFVVRSSVASHRLARLHLGFCPNLVGNVPRHLLVMRGLHAVACSTLGH